LKLLVVASSLDLRVPLSSTPSWWQLLKALAEGGVDLIVAPYQGPAIESPWWSAAANPCEREGNLIGLFKRLVPPRRPTSTTNVDSAADQLTRTLVERFTKPRWRRHLVRLLESNRDTDAVLFLTVPPNHFGGIPRLIADRFGIPTYLYDGDVPASLPSFAGFRTGFKIYAGADLSEYAGLISSSKGGVAELERLGASNVSVLYYAADPTLFTRPNVEEDIDVFFYGHGAEYRETWIDAMLAEPARRMPDTSFAVRGTRLGRLTRVEQLPYASFSKLKEYCVRSRINLLINRQAHASVHASSTARPFELAALGCAMVSNPYLGIEEWFEPGREILIAENDDAAISTYALLLRDPSARNELGHRARQRLLAQHTYDARARELVHILEVASTPTATPAVASALQP
jgi:glycosyltransferase involved in cell wall biosynthesis